MPVVSQVETPQAHQHKSQPSAPDGQIDCAREIAEHVQKMAANYDFSVVDHANARSLASESAHLLGIDADESTLDQAAAMIMDDQD